MHRATAQLRLQTGDDHGAAVAQRLPAAAVAAGAHRQHAIADPEAHALVVVLQTVVVAVCTELDAVVAELKVQHLVTEGIGAGARAARSPGVGHVLRVVQVPHHQRQRKMQVLLQVAVLQGQPVAAHQLGQHLGAGGQHQQAQRHAHQQSGQGLAALALWVAPRRLHGLQQRAGSLSMLAPLLRATVAASRQCSRMGLQALSALCTPTGQASSTWPSASAWRTCSR